MRNAAIIIVAVAVLAVGFVLVQGGSEEAEAPTAVTASTPAATSVAPASSTPTETEAAPEAAPEPEPAPEPEIPTVVFADGKPEGGVQKLEFKKGDEVRFRVRSDVADEIHVHGFDKYIDVTPGKTVGVRFPAEFDGAYEVEMHGTGTEIASLVVQP